MAIILGTNHSIDGMYVCCVEVSYVPNLISPATMILYEYKSADTSKNIAGIILLFQRHLNYGYAFSVQRRRIYGSRASYKEAFNLTGNNDDIWIQE